MSRRQQQAGEFGLMVERLGARLGRGAGEDARTPPEWKQAAVALVLRERAGEAELLVIKRADDPRDHWSGHLALPGGRRDPGDPDLAFTAVRETREELGLDLWDGGRVLGPLEMITPRSPRAPQFAVKPFVAVAPRAYHVGPEGGAGAPLSLSGEVEAAFWVPVPLLKRRGPSEVFRLVLDEEEREWPAYATDYGLIWGLTERILTNFLDLISQTV